MNYVRNLRCELRLQVSHAVIASKVSRWPNLFKASDSPETSNRFETWRTLLVSGSQQSSMRYSHKDIYLTFTYPHYICNIYYSNSLSISVDSLSKYEYTRKLCNSNWSHFSMSTCRKYKLYGSHTQLIVDKIIRFGSPCASLIRKNKVFFRIIVYHHDYHFMRSDFYIY